MKQKKKKRTTTVHIDFGKEAHIGGMNLDDNGILTFYDLNGNKLDPKFIQAGTGYSKTSGKLKTINRHNADPSKINTNPYSILTKYTNLYAIDTNTIEKGGSIYSASTSIKITYTLKGNIWDAHIFHTTTAIFKKQSIASELYGWLDLLNHILRDQNNLKETIGIITDFELDKLSDFNSQKVPLYNDFYLPSNIEFIYASADTGMDFPANRLIRECDKIATNALKENDLSML